MDHVICQLRKNGYVSDLVSTTYPMIGYLKGMIRGYSKGTLGKDGFSLKFEQLAQNLIWFYAGQGWRPVRAMARYVCRSSVLFFALLVNVVFLFMPSIYFLLAI